ncbi:hypothetical protein Tco_1546449 [Tanacetum coccineum]
MMAMMRIMCHTHTHEDENVDIKGYSREEEHPAPADSIAVALPSVDLALSAEETEPFKTDESAATPPPHPAYWVTARYHQNETPISLLLGRDTFSTTTLDTITTTSITTTTLDFLTTTTSRIYFAFTTITTTHHTLLHQIRCTIIGDTPIPLQTSSPPLHLLSTDRRADRPEVTLWPWKRLGITLSPRYEVGEILSTAARPLGGFRANYGFVATIDREIMWDLERDVGYGITDTWDEMSVDMPGAPATDYTDLGQRMIDFTTSVRQDTDEIYTRLDDEQSER